MSVHATAIVDASAQIGKNVSIGAHTVIGPGVKIGDGCKIWPNVVIEYTSLGSNCEVFPNVCLGLTPQHLRYKGEPTRLEIGANGVFREGVTIHRGTPFDESVTRIGDNAYFMCYSHVGHDCRVGSNVTMANGVLLAGHVQVGDNVFISGVAAVHQFARVGKGAIISGGAMATNDVPPFCIAQGDRAVLRGLNVIGMRRLGMDKTAIRQVKDAYKAVFLSGARLEAALQSPELTVDAPAVKIFREFLASSKRGFTRPAAGASASEAEEEVAS
ncbi:MAG: acyl-ACP--UDP-N-acetylglucosamine O-acyltransferase [Elusimicrobia bacterium]|nr:acyl-ACP--UDP-N-acetylglucosamine O-acyltransferase [Elusimicrobiota bacterium]